MPEVDILRLTGSWNGGSLTRDQDQIGSPSFLSLRTVKEVQQNQVRKAFDILQPVRVFRRDLDASQCRRTGRLNGSLFLSREWGVNDSNGVQCKIHVRIIS